MKTGNRLLFASGECPAQKTTKIKVLAGRGGAYKPRQLRIDVIGEIPKSNRSKLMIKKSENIILSNISILNSTQFEYRDDTSKVCTSYFEKLRDVGFKCFGSQERQGIEFEFHNPLNHNVRVYITLLGDAASANMVGKE